jgi:LPXTG-site transpeptidase (sortase) family protein
LVLKPGPWRSENPYKKPEKLASKRRRTISLSLIVAGSALCLYVSGTYGWMYLRQRSLLREWNAHNPAVTQTLTKITIPKIKLEDVVLEGVSDESLMLGPAHMQGSVEPGMPGNAVLAGHRDSFFRRINSLRYGDDIFVTRGDHKYRYIVSGRKIVEPTDLSVIRPTSYTELTLITCYPTHAVGPAPQRLIVIARLAPENLKMTSQAGGRLPGRLGAKGAAPLE